MQQTRGVLEVVGAARVDHEEFPELLSAIHAVNWPSVVEDEHCQAVYEGGCAILTIGAMLGAINLSRAVSDPNLSRKILQRTRDELISLNKSAKPH